ncbi:MAG: YkgJ family cysteine cluster protein, partial [Lentisphaerae bacterium]|nr:YkgJ family cysteine cluster protein [Lentisphaerota bacterium]
CGGQCCKGVAQRVWVATEEMRRFCETRGRLVDGVWYIESRCRHLGEDGKCGIYEDRPYSCLAYAVDGKQCRATRRAFGLLGGGPSVQLGTSSTVLSTRRPQKPGAR